MAKMLVSRGLADVEEPANRARLCALIPADPPVTAPVPEAF